MTSSILMPYYCKDGVTREMDISSAATRPFGFTYQEAVTTPLGPGRVIGVDSQRRLYFQIDGDNGASFWSDCNTEEDFKRKGVCATSAVPDDGFGGVSSHVNNFAGLTTEYHNLKKIRFGGSERTIVMQTHNGPCPVIALANALILKGELTNIAPTGGSAIPAASLRAQLLNFLRQPRPAPRCGGMQDRGDDAPRCLAQVVSDREALESMRRSLLSTQGADRLLHRFYAGLDVSPFFDDIDGFECSGDDNAVVLFALGGVRLIHGWILNDPDDPFFRLSHLSYDQVTVKAYDESDAELAALARVMTQTQSQQMSYVGLSHILTGLSEGEIAVLFYNNHFSTVVMQRGRLCMLASDISFVDRSCIAFQAIDDPLGATSFLDGDGQPSDETLLVVQGELGDAFTEDDILLAQAQLLSESDGTQPVAPDDVIGLLRRRSSGTASSGAQKGSAPPSPAVSRPAVITNSEVANAFNLPPFPETNPLLLGPPNAASQHEQLQEARIRQVMDVCSVDRETAVDALVRGGTLDDAVLLLVGGFVA